MASIGSAIPVMVHGLRRWPRVALVGVALLLLVACGSTPGSTGSTTSRATAQPITVSPSPGPVGPSDAAGSCGRVQVGGASRSPMPDAAVACLTSALRACQAARLVVVEQGVDVVRTDTMSVVPGGPACTVTVAEEQTVVPRPATMTTFTCGRAMVTQGALVLTECSDATTHTFPSQG